MEGLSEGLGEALGAALAEIGAKAARVTPLHGGDLSQVVRVELADGRAVVAKAGELVVREERMLAALGRAGAPVPEVLAVSGQVMLLEALEEAPARPEAWADLGAALARLHARHGAGYGWEEGYAFGRVAIDNGPAADWPGFWVRRRLLAAPEALPADLRARLEALAARLSDILPARPAPALLHGDLWQGNVLFAPGGRAFMIDPACYYGHGEVDLAMLTLFGSPPEAFWQAYGALEPGWQARRAAYQLWPALVHLRLFGAGYRPMVEGLLARLGA